MNSKNLWGKFDSLAYVNDNYSYIHDEDRQIIEILTEFYNKLPQLGKSVEIGCGPNLYPLFLALPKVNKIDVIEYSENNINYLMQQINKISDSWFLFKELIEKLSPLYKKSSILADFKEKIQIKKGSIYELPESKYDLASMFFCAESITDNLQEFERICGKFINCVKPRGFLVASFMENSSGYEIAGVHFPSVVVNCEMLEKIFATATNDLKIHKIKIAKKILRPGYTGMLTLTARRI